MKGGPAYCSDDGRVAREATQDRVNNDDELLGEACTHHISIVQPEYIRTHYLSKEPVKKPHHQFRKVRTP